MARLEISSPKIFLKSDFVTHGASKTYVFVAIRRGLEAQVPLDCRASLLNSFLIKHPNICHKSQLILNPKMP